MKDKALELYLYMGSYEEVIKVFEEEGIKTEEEARRRLAPLAGSNVMGVMSLGAGSLAGTANGSEKILKHFADKEKESEDEQ